MMPPQQFNQQPPQSFARQQTQGRDNRELANRHTTSLCDRIKVQRAWLCRPSLWSITERKDVKRTRLEREGCIQMSTAGI
jgi:hypothetical protein